jgi:kumamolisin
MPFINKGAALALAFTGLSANAATTTATAATSTASSTTAAHVQIQNEGPFMADAMSSTGGQLKKLHGHVPVGAIKNMKDQGKVDEGQQMPITVALTLNNQDQLNEELSQMYQSGSSTFHQFMTPEEFRSKYAPTQDQIEQVKSYLISEGIVPTAVDDNQLLVHAAGSAKAINTALHTEIHSYADAKGKTYFAPAYEVQTDAKMPIQSVIGLSNVNQAHSHAIPKPLSKSSATTPTSATPATSTPKDGSGPDQGLAPADIRTAYNVPTSVNGAGQTLAVFELDGYVASDITAYEQQFGLPNVPLQNVLVDSADGSASGVSAEVTLDIELEIALAPGASKILVYEGPNGDQGIIDTYARIANDNLAKEIGTSWGSSEQGSAPATLQAESAIFQQMAAQGQTIMSAAGDNGSNDNGSSLSVDDPSSQPYVTGVGGTSLTIGTGGTYTSETTWDNSGGAGGGGVSSTWTQPTWQNNVVTAATLGSTTMRNVPDVSLEADTNVGYSIYWQGSWSVWGGTSCAAPLWAAYAALVNQQRQANNKADIGFMNPAIYAVGTGSRYASDFHDIADNSNNGYYPAVKGYDDATGWGSFNGQNLFQDLTND